MSKIENPNPKSKEIESEELENVTGGWNPHNYNNDNYIPPTQEPQTRPYGVPEDYIHCSYSGHYKTCNAGICKLFGTPFCIAGYYSPIAADKRRK